MASIRTKGNRVEVRARVAGRSVSRSFPNLKEARYFAAKVELDPSALCGRKSSVQGVLTLSDALKRYAEQVSVHHKGVKQELLVISHLKRQPFASKSLSAISPQDIATYRDRLLGQELATNTVRIRLVLLSRLFKIARDEWGMDVANPLASIRLPAGSRCRVRRISEDELLRLRVALTQCRNQDIPDLVEFALATAMRQGELFAFHWQDVDFHRGTVLLKMTKNGQSRLVPLTPTAQEILQRRRDAGLSRPFGCSQNALRLSWKGVIRRANLKNLRFHDLRHEAISRWAELVNGDPFRLQLVSGHRSLQMLSRYTHPRVAALVELARSVPVSSVT